MIGVVVPAHDEEQVIGRLLRLMCAGESAGDFEVVVVCNGCSDRTASAARAFPGVHVIEMTDASKAAALARGDAELRGFPRVYVDADVEIDVASLLRLTRALSTKVIATAPRRIIPRERSSLSVRWFYDVWEQLPSVEKGVFGRGVIAVSREGHQVVRQAYGLLADDLAVSAFLMNDQKMVVQDAVVVVHPPRTWRNLVRRRVRAATGTAQVRSTGLVVSDSRTTPQDLLQVLRRSPLLVIKMPVFLSAAVIARFRGMQATRRGDYSTWWRDQSSREA